MPGIRRLQERFPQVELLHMAREVAQHLAAQGAGNVALMATEGTYRVRLYEHALAEAGLDCLVPLQEERRIITRGIFDGVKAGNMRLAEECFSQVALQARRNATGRSPSSWAAPRCRSACRARPRSPG